MTRFKPYKGVYLNTLSHYSTPPLIRFKPYKGVYLNLQAEKEGYKEANKLFQTL